MERRALPGVAGTNGFGRAARGLPGLRVGLGAVAKSAWRARWMVLAAALVAGAGAAFIEIRVRRWAHFETNAYDLAFFDQIIWNTSQGRLFATSFVSYNFAGQHLEPILLAYAPAYWLGAGGQFLMVSQAVAVAASGIALFALARRLGLSPVVALAALVAWFANPFLLRAMGFDFHPEVMAAGPMFVSAWAAASGRRRLAVIAALSMLLFKEDTVFMVLAAAGFMWRRGMHREAKMSAGIGVAYAALAVLVIMPLIRQGEPSDLVDRYGYFLPESGGSGLLLDTLLAPVRVARVLLAPHQLLTAVTFVLCSCPLILTRPRHLAWLAPGLVLALLSLHPPQRALELHYAAELVPVAMVLAVEAAVSLKPRLPAPALAGLLAAPAVVAMVWLSPPGSFVGDSPSDQHRSAVSEALALIPVDASVTVSAQSGLLPRLAHRRRADEFPANYLRAEWILVDRYGFRSSQSLDAGFDRKLERVRRMAELIYSNDGVELYRRPE